MARTKHSCQGGVRVIAQAQVGPVVVVRAAVAEAHAPVAPHRVIT